VRLRLFVVGKGSQELAAYEDRFLERLKPFAPCSIHELPDGRSKQHIQRLQEESRHILGQTSRYILFDERGKSMSSQAWADFFAHKPGDAIVDFVIGGASGVSKEVRSSAESVWSLSKLTLPHQLARVLFLEQSYRA